MSMEKQQQPSKKVRAGSVVAGQYPKCPLREKKERRESKEG
jgi:hypothetical protein